ncbi:GNAT family N-acetyltransferase [Jeotgalibacillus proteolyticus]|uniref:GNAT family N-acetyltransferase n=1 Tax=Jeotgalibacillus proteolyticus TaxID=2082395 RepID=UPI003CF36613
MLQLKPITKHNWEDTLNLTLHEEQKKSIAPNVYSLAQVQFLDMAVAKGIYLDNKMIGFAMYGIDEDDGECWIYRLMIDRDYQGKGYGKQAVHLLIDEFETIKAGHHQYIYISYEPDNDGARFTYQRCGFIETDVFVDGEQVAKYASK